MEIPASPTPAKASPQFIQDLKHPRQARHIHQSGNKKVPRKNRETPLS